MMLVGVGVVQVSGQNLINTLQLRVPAIKLAIRSLGEALRASDSIHKCKLAVVLPKIYPRSGFRGLIPKEVACPDPPSQHSTTGRQYWRFCIKYLLIDDENVILCEMKSPASDKILESASKLIESDIIS